MQLKLHANARLTPKQRAEIQTSNLPVTLLARRFGVTETTVRRWRARAGTPNATADRSHTRHNLNPSTTAAEEELIKALRVDARLSLDDIVEVMHRCVNKNLSRSAIHRCLQRRGVSGRPQEPQTNTPRVKPFEETSCGYIHVDLKHLTPLEGQACYAFVAIERITRFAHIEIITNRTADTVSQAFSRFIAVFPQKIHTVLTDNGSEFTDRFGNAAATPKGRKPTGTHAFDRVCATHNIKHKLTKPYHPQTNGMVERFNRRISEALRNQPFCGTNSGRNKFTTIKERNAFLQRFVDAYNKTRLQCLNYTAPIQMLHNHTGDNTKAGGWRLKGLSRL